MRSLALILLVMLIVASSLEAQDISAWFPLQTGDQWTYEHETRDGNRLNPEVERWTTTATIRGSVTIPEGTIILREIKVVEGKPACCGWINKRSEFPYLVRGSCIYFLDPPDWDEASRQLSRSFREGLLNGEISPALCLPMQLGSHWEAPKTGDLTWRVEGMGQAGSFGPEPVDADDFHVISRNAGSGGTAHLWFRKGVGITAQWYSHNGTYDESRERLVAFNPAK